MNIFEKFKFWLLPKELKRFSFDSFVVISYMDDRMVEGKTLDYLLKDEQGNIVYVSLENQIAYLKKGKMSLYPISFLPSNIQKTIYQKFKFIFF